MSDEVTASNRRKHGIVLIVVLVVFLALVGGAGWYAHSNGLWPFSSKPTGTQTVTSTASSKATPSPSPVESSTEPSVEPTQAEPTEAVSAARQQADEYIEEVTAHNELNLPKPTPDADAEPPLTHAHEHTSPEVILEGEEWFGRQGVNVCAPSDQDMCGDEPSVGDVPYNRWQSVELAQRHYQAMGWYDGIFEGVEGAVDIYAQAESLGMTTQPYNDVQQIAYGDLIVHNSAGYESADEGYGRVSVINFHEGNVIHAVEQNGNPNARAVYLVVDNTLIRVDVVDGKLVTTENTVKGVVHSPNNTNNPLRDLREGFDEAEFNEYLELVKEVAEQ